MEPKPSWILVVFITSEPQQELPKSNHFKVCSSVALRAFTVLGDRATWLRLCSI